MLNRELPIWAPMQSCGQLPMQKIPLSGGFSTIAPMPNAASSKTPTSTFTSIITEERSLFAQLDTFSSTIGDFTVSTSVAESENTRRARYAANQRHSKAQKARKDSHQSESISKAETRATERKQRHREKNKVAAFKCRSRQRKQVQTIQEKGSRLGEENAKLKTMIQELRGELNRLRSVALYHQQCNCSVARYNHDQAERIVANYRSSHVEKDFGGFSHPQ